MNDDFATLSNSEYSFQIKPNQTKSNQIKQFQKNRNEKKNRSRKLENEQKRH